MRNIFPGSAIHDVRQLHRTYPYISSHISLILYSSSFTGAQTALFLKIGNQQFMSPRCIIQDDCHDPSQNFVALRISLILGLVLQNASLKRNFDSFFFFPFVKRGNQQFMDTLRAFLIFFSNQEGFLRKKKKGKKKLSMSDM